MNASPGKPLPEGYPARSVHRRGFLTRAQRFARISVLAALAAFGLHAAHASPPLDPYNVVWDTPSDDSRGSMPVGNGDIGANVWVEKSTGDLVFYISKTDAWGGDVYGSYGLPKVGRVRVKLDPNPFTAGAPFRQTLDLQDGTIEIEGGDGARKVALKFWIDANHPVIHVDEDGAQPEKMTVVIDTYRTKLEHALNADIVFPAKPESIGWCNRNTNTKIPALANLTFGALIQGKDLTSADDKTLQSRSAEKQFHVRIYPLTAQTETAEAWRSRAEAEANADRVPDGEHAFRDHQRWWGDFWDRSWVVATGNDDADTVTRGYFLQRYVTACAGRGAFPIKFNGTIFTSDYSRKVKDRTTNVEHDEMVDADYRDWGGQYWFQNTRPMYWPMMQSGDFDMMQPLFQMYRKKLEAAEKQVHDYYGHDGAYFAETNPFWSDLPHLTADSPPLWTNRYFTPILELSAMMLDYYAYTGDRDFVRKTLVPIADDGLTFFEDHFPKDASGKIYLDADNAIETYWKVQNPAPDIAGLHYVVACMLLLPDELTTPELRSKWKKMQGELPDLPIGERKGSPHVLLPFATAEDPKRKNGENPEIYAVYPFRLYGLGKPDLQLARDTFAVRDARGSTCWLQDPIHAAYIGDAALAAKDVSENFSDKSRNTQLRFPAFWGPFHDYSPDEDNGGNGVGALQLMLLQSDEGKMLLLPAWPADWDANFKLHAPQNTIVEATVKAGKITSVKVTPSSRARDLYLVAPNGDLKPFTNPDK